jgi:hypothetical protein
VHRPPFGARFSRKAQTAATPMRVDRNLFRDPPYSGRSQGL